MILSQLSRPNRPNTYSRIIGAADVPQPNDYTCWPAACASINRHFGFQPQTVRELASILGTTKEKSTFPSRVVQYYQSIPKASVFAKQGMSIGDLANAANSGHLTIVAVRDYGARMPARRQANYGHALLVMGVMPSDDEMDGDEGALSPGYVVCQDPSEDNIIKPRQQSIQAKGKILIEIPKFLKCWRDVDGAGRRLERFGITVGVTGMVGVIGVKDRNSPVKKQRATDGKWKRRYAADPEVHKHLTDAIYNADGHKQNQAKLVWADYLEENGYPATAEAARRSTQSGMEFHPDLGKQIGYHGEKWFPNSNLNIGLRIVKNSQNGKPFSSIILHQLDQNGNYSGMPLFHDTDDLDLTKRVMEEHHASPEDIHDLERFPAQAHHAWHGKYQRSAGSSVGPAPKRYALNSNLRSPASLVSAQRVANSTNQQVKAHVAKDIFSTLRLGPTESRDVIHDYRQGSRPSIVVKSPTINPASEDEFDTSSLPVIRSARDKFQYAASWLGLMLHEPGVLVFHAGPGNDLLHSIEIDGSKIEQARQGLDRIGCADRLISTPKATNRGGISSAPNTGGLVSIAVFDRDAERGAALGQLAQALGVKLMSTRGNGNFIGGDDPKSARHKFRQKIREYEGRVASGAVGGVAGDGQSTQQQIQQQAQQQAQQQPPQQFQRRRRYAADPEVSSHLISNILGERFSAERTAHKLTYADYLEENGMPATAALLRMQLEDSEPIHRNIANFNSPAATNNFGGRLYSEHGSTNHGVLTDTGSYIDRNDGSVKPFVLIRLVSRHHHGPAHNLYPRHFEVSGLESSPQRPLSGSIIHSAWTPDINFAKRVLEENGANRSRREGGSPMAMEFIDSLVSNSGDSGEHESPKKMSRNVLTKYRYAADPEVHAHLLDNIENDPTNPSHKLTYADWLEENGQPATAEIIRQGADIGNNPNVGGLAKGLPSSRTHYHHIGMIRLPGQNRRMHYIFMSHFGKPFVGVSIHSFGPGPKRLLRALFNLHTPDLDLIDRFIDEHAHEIPHSVFESKQLLHSLPEESLKWHEQDEARREEDHHNRGYI